MSEEKDEATIAMEQAHIDAGQLDGGRATDLRVVCRSSSPPGPAAPPGCGAQESRVMSILHTLPPRHSRPSWPA